MSGQKCKDCKECKKESKLPIVQVAGYLAYTKNFGCKGCIIHE